MKEEENKEEKYSLIPEGLKAEIQAHEEWLESSQEDEMNRVMFHVVVLFPSFRIWKWWRYP